jgi:hypothetical protein
MMTTTAVTTAAAHAVAETAAIAQARAACVAALPAIEKRTPGDGAALRVPVGGAGSGEGFVRVRCYHDRDGNLIVRVTKPHRARHYHIVIDETRP